MRIIRILCRAHEAIQAGREHFRGSTGAGADYQKRLEQLRLEQLKTRMLRNARIQEGLRMAVE